MVISQEKPVLHGRCQQHLKSLSQSFHAEYQNRVSPFFPFIWKGFLKKTIFVLQDHYTQLFH